MVITFREKIKSVSFALILALGFIFIPCISHGEIHTLKFSKVIVFYSPGCHNCIRVEEEIARIMDKGFKNDLKIEYRNVDNIENFRLLLSLEELHQSKIRNILPVVYFKGRFVNGKGRVRKNLERLFVNPATPVGIVPKNLPKIDLVNLFNSFTLPAIIAVGLVDGINPCAITVIVFFMSFLAAQEYRKRDKAVIGLVFIFSVYLTYCLIGMGIFESLYKLQGFWLLSRIINITIGIISIIFGFHALCDFIQYRRTGSTDGLRLSLSRRIENWTHKVIGCFRLKTRSDSPVSKKPIIGLVVSALVAGFLVSILEAVCVAKIYLPTIVFVLKTTSIKLRALTYLLLYNLLFIMPLLIIFSFAIAGTTSEQFSKVLRGHLGLVKILMSVVFLGLGIFLILKA